jgi:hypothetical protein
MAPTTNRKILTPRLKAARLLQDASTVDRSPSPACTAIYRTLHPALLLRFLHQWQGGAGAAGCGLHPNGLLRLAPSIRCRQHLSPGGRHPSPCTWSRWSWARGLPPPRAFYRPAPERVSSHAVSFGHMMAGPSGPTTTSTWPSVPPETVTAWRSALETTSSGAWADFEPELPVLAIGDPEIQ